MAKLTDRQMMLLRGCIDDAITARRRGEAKSVRPEFKVIYAKEVGELLALKPVLEEIHGENKR